MDKSGKISAKYHVKDTSQKTIFITESKNFPSTENCIYENAIFGNSLADSILKILYESNIQSVLIEGGTTTLQTFINEGLWDEARIFN